MPELWSSTKKPSASSLITPVAIENLSLDTAAVASIDDGIGNGNAETESFLVFDATPAKYPAAAIPPAVTSAITTIATFQPAQQATGEPHRAPSSDSAAASTTGSSSISVDRWFMIGLRDLAKKMVLKSGRPFAARHRTHQDKWLSGRPGAETVVSKGCLPLRLQRSRTNPV
jgi:hypothetical protein